MTSLRTDSRMARMELDQLLAKKLEAEGDVTRLTESLSDVRRRLEGQERQLQVRRTKAIHSLASVGLILVLVLNSIKVTEKKGRAAKEEKMGLGMCSADANCALMSSIVFRLQLSQRATSCYCETGLLSCGARRERWRALQCFGGALLRMIWGKCRGLLRPRPKPRVRQKRPQSKSAQNLVSFPLLIQIINTCNCTEHNAI